MLKLKDYAVTDAPFGSRSIEGSRSINRQAGARTCPIASAGEVVQHFVALGLRRLRDEGHKQEYEDEEQEQDHDRERRTVRPQVRSEKHIWKSPLVMHWILSSPGGPNCHEPN
jgi:hypothetical protein